MSDAMMFPETIEEFIDQYKFIDTDQIYTNGSELIQVFRVMQWVEHERALDAEPIKHGHWIMLHKTHNVDGDNDYDWRCSECNHVDCHNINVEVPYCWYCGAKMDYLDEVEEDEID